MKKIVHQPKIHYYILFFIVLCRNVHAATSKAGSANTTAKKSQIQQPVHQAAKEGNITFLEQLANKYTQKEITKLVNTKDKSNSNWTPLHYATANGKKEVVRFILNQPDITVNAVTSPPDKQTALHLLIVHKNFDLLDLFIDYRQKQKAEPKKFTRLYFNRKDSHGNKPFDYFPKEKTQQLAQYSAKWDKLVGNTPKQSVGSKPKPPKIILQEKQPSVKQQTPHQTSAKPPLPPNINMEPLSPTASPSTVTFSLPPFPKANIDHSTVSHQPLGIRPIATINKWLTQSIHMQTAQYNAYHPIPRQEIAKLFPDKAQNPIDARSITISLATHQKLLAQWARQQNTPPTHIYVLLKMLTLCDITPPAPKINTTKTGPYIMQWFTTLLAHPKNYLQKAAWENMPSIIRHYTSNLEQKAPFFRVWAKAIFNSLNGVSQSAWESLTALDTIKSQRDDILTLALEALAHKNQSISAIAWGKGLPILAKLYPIQLQKQPSKVFTLWLNAIQNKPKKVLRANAWSALTHIKPLFSKQWQTHKEAILSVWQASTQDHDCLVRKAAWEALPELHTLYKKNKERQRLKQHFITTCQYQIKDKDFTQVPWGQHWDYSKYIRQDAWRFGCPLFTKTYALAKKDQAHLFQTWRQALQDPAEEVRQSAWERLQIMVDYCRPQVTKNINTLLQQWEQGCQDQQLKLQDIDNTHKLLLQVQEKARGAQIFCYLRYLVVLVFFVAIAYLLTSALFSKNGVSNLLRRFLRN